MSFITHDGGVGIFRADNPGLNVFSRICIRSNCFIGLKSILLPFGIAKMIIADSGKELKNKIIISFFESIGTTMHFTTIGRHQANGQIELSFNGTVKDWASR